MGEIGARRILTAPSTQPAAADAAPPIAISTSDSPFEILYSAAASHQRNQLALNQSQAAATTRPPSGNRSETRQMQAQGLRQCRVGAPRAPCLVRGPVGLGSSSSLLHRRPHSMRNTKVREVRNMIASLPGRMGLTWDGLVHGARAHAALHRTGESLVSPRPQQIGLWRSGPHAPSSNALIAAVTPPCNARATRN